MLGLNSREELRARHSSPPRRDVLPRRYLRAQCVSHILYSILLESDIDRASWDSPTKAPVALICPITHAAPTEDQPPKLLKVWKTFEAGAFGASAHSGMMMAKNPNMCKHKIMPSSKGSFRAPKVLIRVPKAPTAIIRSVTCHGRYVKPSLLRTAS